MYFIYFIKVAENIKIGICKATSKHLKQRLGEANRWSPNSKILGLIATNDAEDEKKLHSRFKKHQISSEVFSAHKEILDFIKSNNTSACVEQQQKERPQLSEKQAIKLLNLLEIETKKKGYKIIRENKKSLWVFHKGFTKDTHKLTWFRVCQPIYRETEEWDVVPSNDFFYDLYVDLHTKMFSLSHLSTVVNLETP